VPRGMPTDGPSASVGTNSRSATADVAIVRARTSSNDPYVYLPPYTRIAIPTPNWTTAAATTRTRVGAMLIRLASNS